LTLHEINLTKAVYLSVSVGLIALIIYFTRKKRYRDNKWITAWNVFILFAFIAWIPANLFFKRHDSALISAIEKGDIKEAKIALDDGADINYPFRGGGTFLHVVVIRNGDINIAKFLIEQGVAVNETNRDGLTALELARQYKREKLYKYLKTIMEQSPNQQD
jgi:hypothetical protein